MASQPEVPADDAVFWPSYAEGMVRACCALVVADLILDEGCARLCLWPPLLLRSLLAALELPWRRPHALAVLGVPAKGDGLHSPLQPVSANI